MPRPPRLLLLTTLSVLGGFALACGFITDKISEKASDKIAEKAVEAQTGGNASVDINKGQLNIKTDQGSLNFQSGQTTLPDGFPSDVPLYSGATITSSAAMNQPDGKAFMVQFKSADAPDKVSAFYKEKLAGTFQSKADVNANGQLMGMYATADEKRSVQITVSADGTGSQVSLVVTQK